MTLILIWLISIVACAVIANEKKHSVGLFIFLGFVLGPLAVIILLLIGPPKDAGLAKSYEPTGILTHEDMLRELNILRSAVKSIQERIDRFELSMNSPQAKSLNTFPEILRTGGPEAGPLPSAACEAGRVPQGQDPSQNIGMNNETPIKTFDLEMAFGRDWLSKIGIVVFMIGMVFLISYTFKYFGPVVKILLGYVVSLLFFFFGKKLEHNAKFVHFGRVVWGGGWALAYFTTYAMHHFPASRLMDNPYLNLALLAGLVIGLLAYVVKYKNEDMMALALFASYVAATMGQVTNFTLLSSLLLVGIVLFLVYKFQWIKTLALSIVLTYGIHQIWVVPNIASSGGQIFWWTVTSAQFAQLMNLTFLSVYGLMFLVAVHIARTENDPAHVNTVAALNFWNIACYSVLVFPLVNWFFYAQRFEIVLGFGLVLLVLAMVMKKINRPRLYQSDLICGLFMLTLSLPLKFAAHSWLLMWMIEVPFLLLIGTRFKEKIYTYIGYILTFLVFLQIVLIGEGLKMDFLGWTMMSKDFLLFCAGTSMSASYFLLAKNQDKKSVVEVDQVFGHIFSGSACFYFTVLLFSVVQKPWMSFGLSVEAVFLLVLSTVLEMRRFRVYSYLVLAAAWFLFFDQKFYSVTAVVKWFMIAVQLFIFGGFYYAVKSMKKAKFLSSLFDKEEVMLFAAGLTLLGYTIFDYFPANYISLNLGIAGALLIVAGIWAKDKIERLGGLVLLGITLCRVIFVDISDLDMVFKIITFIVIGLLFLGASYVYNRFGSEK